MYLAIAWADAFMLLECLVGSTYLKDCCWNVSGLEKLVYELFLEISVRHIMINQTPKIDENTFDQIFLR